MSDYLWDKSGEPDAEVQRLEALLGELRYQPGRKLELPPEMIAPARSHSSWYPAFAVAAALALMILAGVWLAVVRRQGVVKNLTEAATPKVIETNPAPPLRTDAIAASSESESVSNLSNDDRRAARRESDRVVPASQRQHREWRVRQGSLNRRSQFASNAQRRKDNLPEMLEANRAKEQLMLALHVASAKINLAQRKAPGITDVSPGGSY